MENDDKSALAIIDQLRASVIGKDAIIAEEKSKRLEAEAKVKLLEAQVKSLEENQELLEAQVKSLEENQELLEAQVKSLEEKLKLIPVELGEKTNGSRYMLNNISDFFGNNYQLASVFIGVPIIVLIHCWK